jgi:hypothetical protein
VPCEGRGTFLEVDQARKAFWDNRTPHARAQPEVRAWWSGLETKWAQDPLKAPFLRRLAIESVDYHGLWADVTWWESYQKSGKEKTTVTRRLIRIGRRWYWFTKGVDDSVYDLPEDGKPTNDDLDGESAPTDDR